MVVTGRNRHGQLNVHHKTAFQNVTKDRQLASVMKRKKERSIAKVAELTKKMEKWSKKKILDYKRHLVLRYETPPGYPPEESQGGIHELENGNFADEFELTLVEIAIEEELAKRHVPVELEGNYSSLYDDLESSDPDRELDEYGE